MIHYITFGRNRFLYKIQALIFVNAIIGLD